MLLIGMIMVEILEKQQKVQAEEELLARSIILRKD